MDKKQLRVLRYLCGYYFFVAVFYEGISISLPYLPVAFDFWALVVIAPLMLATLLLINYAEQNKGDK